VFGRFSHLPGLGSRGDRNTRPVGRDFLSHPSPVVE
jgi:hypothetical protein